jgi:MFS superfamily sulfate permease-like transporter
MWSLLKRTVSRAGTLRYARLDRQEISGSLGDLGTFLPLLLAMTAHNGLDFATALFFAGLFNIITGLTFSIPMAVQPMKAIAVVAIAQGLSAPEIAAAGATVSAIVLVLGILGVADRLNRLVPRSVVRGVQLALAMSLVMKGIQMVAETGTWFGADSWLLGLAAATTSLVLLSSRKIPAALLLFAAGLVLAVLRAPEALEGVSVGWTLPGWHPPGWSDFVSSFPSAALPQIPLTVLNSVVAVCALAGDLFPQRAPSPRRVAVSVGMMNLVACWFGGMPMCHGAGGLAGQYRFGARTNGSILFLGTVKLLVAVLFGASLMALCRVFPLSILGAMVVMSGLELASGIRDQTHRADIYAMLGTAGASLALNNVALGLAVGLGVVVCLRIAKPFTDARPAAATVEARDPVDFSQPT